MTKAEWISMVKWRLPQIDKTKKYDERLIERYINMFRNKYLHDTLRKTDSNISFYAKEYKNQSILLDSDTDIYYTLLPATVVQLPYNQEGIVKIQSETGTGLEYVPIDEEDLELLDDLYSMNSIIDSTIGFVLKEDRVLYDKNMTASTAANPVKISMVQDFVSYSSGDVVIMPQGRDAEIITETVNFMLGIPPKDLISNNSD